MLVKKKFERYVSFIDLNSRGHHFFKQPREHVTESVIPWSAAHRQRFRLVVFFRNGCERRV